MRGSSEHAEAAATAAAYHDRFEFGGREVSDVLLALLSEMSASTPQLLDTKKLESSDVRKDQNRLQFSARSPISHVFTDGEMSMVKSEDGMPVRVYDYQGRQYEMRCRLWKEKHYRFRGDGWMKFKCDNDLMIPKGAELTQHVTVEVWAFRSLALPPPEGKDDGGGKGSGHPHPDGSLGLIMLFDKEEEAAGEEIVHAESLGSKCLMLMAAHGLLALRAKEKE